MFDIEKVINVDTVEQLINLFGSFDENVGIIENEYGVTTVCRDTEVKISGEENSVNKASKVILNLIALTTKGQHIEEQTVRYVISSVNDGTDENLAKVLTDCVCVTAKGKPIKAKTVGQKNYLDAIAKNIVTLGIGPAGTGKTYLAVAMAVTAFREKKVSRIILTRPAVEAGEKLGFLPGDLQNKVDPYLRPLHDALFDMLGTETYARMQEKNIIEIAPLAYMRGRTLDDSFIILDEAQNTTPEQMKMFLTRIGFNTKAVVTGDITQIDLPEGKKCGLKEAMKVIADIDEIAVINLTDRDVVRHQLVGKIVKAYEKYHNKSRIRK